jgi:hypothetical protein
MIQGKSSIYESNNVMLPSTGDSIASLASIGTVPYINRHFRDSCVGNEFVSTGIIEFSGGFTNEKLQRMAYPHEGLCKLAAMTVLE